MYIVKRKKLKKPKKVIGYHFSKGVLAHEDGRVIKEGRTHKVRGYIYPGEQGLHASPKALEAAREMYHVIWPMAKAQPGSKLVISLVQLSGEVVPDYYSYPQDDPRVYRWAASQRKYLKVIECTVLQAEKIDNYLNSDRPREVNRYVNRLLGLI